MRALWFENGVMTLRDLPDPVPRPGDALIDILAVGICNTDLELARGYMNFTGVPGHEFVGRVRIGPDDLIGRLVVGEINIGCGSCPECLAGDSRHCVSREVLGIFKKQGAFAERLTLPVQNLHAVPEGVTLDEAVFVEPLAAALRIPEQIALTPGTPALVVGDGKLAQLIVRVFAHHGVSTTVLCRYRTKLDLLAPFAHRAILSNDYTDADRFPLVVECSGKPSGLALARRAVEPKGTLILKSTYAEKVELDLSSYVVDEIRILGSRCGPFPPALDMLARKAVDPAPLISSRFPFADVIAAFAAAKAPGALKVVVCI